METLDQAPLVTDIAGRKSLLKPPFSTRLKSGSVTLAPGEDVGVHRTDSREEVIIVLRGIVTVMCAGEDFIVKEKQLMYIPPEMEHNVINHTAAPVEYVYVVTPVGNETQTHDHHGHVHHH